MTERAEKAVEPDEILPPAKRGRPRIKVDLDLLERLAGLQCTDYEMAQVLGISKRVFCERKATDPEFMAAYNYGRSMGTVSLRKWQFDHAKRGNSTMLARLGEQYLGQGAAEENEADMSFELEVVTTGDADGGSVPVAVDEDENSGDGLG